MIQTIRSTQFHKFWLIITSILVGSFGPVFFLGSMESTSELPRLCLDLLSWPIDQKQSYSGPTIRFLSAITGGFLLGWGVMIFCLRKWLFDTAPEAVRRIVLISLLSWFLLDSAGSIASQTYSNVFLMYWFLY